MQHILNRTERNGYRLLIRLPSPCPGPGSPSWKHSLSVQWAWDDLSSDSSRRIAISWLKMHSHGSNPPSAMTLVFIVILEIFISLSHTNP